jgi:hypothetical protein
MITSVAFVIRINYAYTVVSVLLLALNVYAAF